MPATGSTASRAGRFAAAAAVVLSTVSAAEAQPHMYAPASLRTLFTSAAAAPGDVGGLDPHLVPAGQTATAQPTHTNPWGDRPVCASMFMKSDWQLSPKQRVCDWLHNGVFSTNGMLGAAWSAGMSKARDSGSERGDSFVTRFSRKAAQSAIKATASVAGGFIMREDPRARPPYLIMRTEGPPGGFWRRTGRALANNFIAYRCEQDCSLPEHIDTVPALSRIIGSIASGFASELWTSPDDRSHRRAWRGAASAYASTFVNSLLVEFKPELSAFAGKAFTKIFGAK